MTRTIIARTAENALVVAEIRDTARVWYAIQDATQATLVQHETKGAAMADWRSRTRPPVLHASMQSARRRNVVHLCDGETVSPHTTEQVTEVTCPRCAKLLAVGTHRWDDAAGRWRAN